MTPREKGVLKRKQTMLRKVMEQNPHLSEAEVVEVYKQNQRDIASKGGKNPNSHRGFRDIEVAKRAGRISRVKSNERL